MKMDSKGLQKYIEEYMESHRGEFPTFWKVYAFRWERGMPIERTVGYFASEEEAELAFSDERYASPVRDNRFVGACKCKDGEEWNPASWKVAQCGRRIVLAIKPEYAERILDGTKQFEYRKRVPDSPVSQIVIYETAPVGKIVGTVDVYHLIEGAPDEIYEKTAHAAGIGKQDYDEYFKGAKKAYAFALDTPVRFDHPVPIEKYGLKSAPQSFAYVKEEGKWLTY